MTTSIENYTYINDDGFRSFNIDLLPNKESCIVAINQSKSDARLERCKSVGNAALCLSVSACLLAVSLIAGKIASLVFGIIALPLIFIPPLYGLVTFIGAVGTTFIVANKTIRQYGQQYLQYAKDHWNLADRYYTQAVGSALRKAQLAS